MKAILLGGPEHGRIEYVNNWPIKVLNRDAPNNIAEYESSPYSDVSLATTTYHDRKITCWDRISTVGVHSSLTDPYLYSALLFNIFIKEFYHDLFKRR